MAAAGELTSAEHQSRSFVRWITIAGQFGLFVALLYQFNLESPAFVRLSLLALAGWLIHYFLPRSYRMPFFVLLSLAGIGLVFGYKPDDGFWKSWHFAGFVEGAWILALGLGLIALCHLPISLAWRALMLLAAGVALAAARMGWISVPWSEAIWPVLASMFMFRLIVYVYEIRHEKTPVTLTERLAYFFMLPNVCFPLFPVVDLQTFRRTYYDHPDRHYIYQTGILWMFRGAFHLILYRLIYQNFVIDASEVQDRADLVQFMLWPFLLYLRISGTFHIITGLLHLFGFNLPETHKLYFLSSSFTDFWRRINIYWKDFIMKIFYYPLYFRLRRWGETTAVISATLLAFLVTWLLHNYQWFWVRGSWNFTWNDFLFWMILGVLVAGNALHEIRRGRTRRLQGKALSWREALTVAPRTIGVFVVISVLWSFWSASSPLQWFSTLDAVAVPSPGGGDPLVVLIVAALILAVPAVALARGAMDQTYSFARSAAWVAIPGAITVGISFPEIYNPFGSMVTTAMASVKSSELNRRDFASFERGYYEDLTNVGGFNPELWMQYAAKPGDWETLQDTALARPTGGLPEIELLPLTEITFKQALVHTNRWGMRDKDYEKTPPPNTLRIAVLGSSHVFGSGVANDETFESILERRLNQDTSGSLHKRYELLNFAVAGYSPLDTLVAFEEQALEFEPDYLFYFEHTQVAQTETLDVARAIKNGAAFRYGFLRDVAAEAGLAKGADIDELQNKLVPYEERVLRGIYARMIEVARKNGIHPVWIYLPRVRSEEPPQLEMRLAREAGFTILQLSGVYDGVSLRSLKIAPWDAHPNAVGHRLIADRLYALLRDSEDVVPLGLSNHPDVVDRTVQQ
jgi:hypothetical protein